MQPARLTAKPWAIPGASPQPRFPDILIKVRGVPYLSILSRVTGQGISLAAWRFAPPEFLLSVLPATNNKYSGGSALGGKTYAAVFPLTKRDFAKRWKLLASRLSLSFPKREIGSSNFPRQKTPFIPAASSGKFWRILLNLGIHVWRDFVKFYRRRDRSQRKHNPE